MENYIWVCIILVLVLVILSRHIAYILSIILWNVAYEKTKDTKLKTGQNWKEFGCSNSYYILNIEGDAVYFKTGGIHTTTKSYYSKKNFRKLIHENTLSL